MEHQNHQILTGLPDLELDIPKNDQFLHFDQFLAKISQKSGNNFQRIARFGPGYPQKSLILALLKNFWQKSGKATFSDLPTKSEYCL